MKITESIPPGDRPMAAEIVEPVLSGSEAAMRARANAELDAVSDAFYDVFIHLGVGDIDAAEGAYDRLEEHLRSIDDMEQISLGAVF